MSDEGANVSTEFLKRKLAELENLERSTVPSDISKGGGGDRGGGNMEARIAKLESTVEHIGTDIADIKIDVRGLRDGAQSDFRFLFGAIITTALGLAGLMAKGFGWL